MRGAVAGDAEEGVDVGSHGELDGVGAYGGGGAVDDEGEGIAVFPGGEEGGGELETGEEADGGG